MRTLDFVMEQEITGTKAQVNPEEQNGSERELRFRAVFDNALDAIIIADNNGVYLEANPAASELLGAPPEHLIGRKLTEFSPTKSVDAAETRWIDFLRDGAQKCIFELERADGKVIIVDYSAKAHFLPDRHLLVLRDVTQGLRTSRDLEKSLINLNEIKKALDESSIVVTTDKTGQITYVNVKFCEISKYSPDETLGQNHRIINSGFHSKEFFQDLWQTIVQGAVWHGEIKNQAKDKTFYWVATTIVPFLGIDGNPFQYIAISHDITERKHLESALRRTAQLTLAGELASSLAHEIKNPLAGIKGAVDILIQRRTAEDEERVVLESVRHEIERIDETVRALLNRAHPRQLNFKQTSLTETISRAAQLAFHQASFHRSRNQEITIESDLPPEPLIFPHDAAQIEDAVLNLIINGIEAIGENKGRVIVRLKKAQADGRGEILIEVEDTGRGIPEPELPKIFSPFFTTTENGTGLGLAAVRRIARAHGGNCEVCSTVGHGSTFTIRLPFLAEIGNGFSPPPNNQ